MPNFIFIRRWLQLPQYLGLILAQCVCLHQLMWQTLIHLAFLASSIAIAYTDRVLNLSQDGSNRRHPPEQGV